MRIRNLVPDPAYHFDADADPDFDAMRIQVTKMMRIRIHNTGRKSPGFDLIILQHSGIRGAADEAVLRIRDPVPFWPLDPGWVKTTIRIRDERTSAYFLELRNNFLGENT